MGPIKCQTCKILLAGLGPGNVAVLRGEAAAAPATPSEGESGGDAERGRKLYLKNQV